MSDKYPASYNCKPCTCTKPETEQVACGCWGGEASQWKVDPSLIRYDPSGDVIRDGNGNKVTVTSWAIPFKQTDQYDQILEELRTLHSVKSGGYGTGEDGYANFTAVAALTGQPRYLYATLRAIEKLTRVLSLHEQGRVQELSEEFTDIASLAICAEALRRLDG